MSSRGELKKRKRQEQVEEAAAKEEEETRSANVDVAAAVDPPPPIFSLQDEIFRDDICCFLDRPSIFELIQEDKLCYHFELSLYFCGSHGTRLSIVSKKERKKFKKHRKKEPRVQASLFPCRLDTTCHLQSAWLHGLYHGCGLRSTPVYRMR
jgi:hypothetical protein